MTWKFQGQNKQIRLTEWKKIILRGACQHNLLPFLTWQQFPLGSCRSPMHFPSKPHFSMELPQPIRFWTSAGTELLELSICFPLASFFLPVNLSYFCLGETFLLLFSCCYHHFHLSAFRVTPGWLSLVRRPGQEKSPHPKAAVNLSATMTNIPRCILSLNFFRNLL